MIKRCTLLRRREDVPAAAFRDHWSTVHADIAAGFDGLSRYHQNHVTRICWQTGHPRFQVDGIVELWFASQADVDRAAYSETTKALIVDEPNFLSGLTALVVGEAEGPAPEDAGAKYMILARTDAPGRLTAAVAAYGAARVSDGAAPLLIACDALTPGFTRETLWAEPLPPTLLVSIRTRDPHVLAKTGALHDLFAAEAEASLAVAVDDLRIV